MILILTLLQGYKTYALAVLWAVVGLGLLLFGGDAMAGWGLLMLQQSGLAAAIRAAIEAAGFSVSHVTRELPTL